MRVAVTGGAGHIGRAIVDELQQRGYQVVVGDRAAQAVRGAAIRQMDAEDLGQMTSLFDGCDAVVHAAAIPRPGGVPDHVLFRINTMALFNALEACRLLNIKRFVWTSSMSVLGYPFFYRPIIPQYLPFDERHPHDPQDPYALSKALGEQLVAAYAARCDMTAISLRIVWAHTPETFKRDLAPVWENPAAGASNLWAYVDTRDCGRAARLAIECDASGHHACFISATDSCMPIPTRRLISEYLPGAPEPDQRMSEYGSLFDISGARELLGYEPQHSWSEYGLNH